MTGPVIAARTTVRAAAALGVAAGIGLVAGCGSSGGSTAGPTSTVTVTATPSAPSTSSAPSGGSGSAQPSAGTNGAGGAPGCATSALRIGLGHGDGAAGSTYVPLQFTNTSAATCTLYGFPGVSFVTGKGGSQIGLPASEDHTLSRQLITLVPGAQVHATLRVIDALNFQAGACKVVTAHWLRVFPPGQTAPGYVSFTAKTCSSSSASVRVLSVQAARGGSGNP